MASTLGAPRHWRRGILTALVVLAVPWVHAPACAQDATSEEDLEEGRRQYREGLSLEAAGDWARALRRFEAVARVRLTPQVRFHIARNKEKLGRLTEALGDYRLAEYEATNLTPGELAEIRQARQSLENRVPKLQMSAIGSMAGATIELDGVEIGKDRLGAAMPLDPGQHRVVVAYEDGTSRQYIVEVREGVTQRLELIGRAEASDLAPPLPPTGPPMEARVNWWPWVAAGAGTASLVAGGVLFYRRQQAIEDLEEACKGEVCPGSYEDTYENGKTYSVLAPIAVGVGVAGIGAAVLGFTVLAPGRSGLGAAAGSVRLELGVVPGQFGAKVSGGF